jgi:hypothetical protein
MGTALPLHHTNVPEFTQLAFCKTLAAAENYLAGEKIIFLYSL